MIDKIKLLREFQETFDLLSLGERLMMRAAWETAWNLATANANNQNMTLEEAFIINKTEIPK